MENNKVGCRIGCFGCLGFILFILVFWAMVFGLKTTWGELNIDLIPPAIRLEK